MGITVAYDEARQRLIEAIRWAESTKAVPAEWTKRTAIIGESPSKTYTVALGTGLLARATDDRVDALALKESSSSSAYSARTLAHTILVPASVEYGFDLRATGREPLNNQPFFRYDRIDAMDRVHSRAQSSHRYLVECLQHANRLIGGEALGALAAFLRVRFAAAREFERVDLNGIVTGIEMLAKAASTYLAEDPEGGKRAQALVAAAYDLVYEQVRVVRINDPSRHYPGDVQAFALGRPVLAAEVRAKPMSISEVMRFSRSIADAGISRGMVVAMAPSQSPLPRSEVRTQALREHGVFISVVESAEELLLGALAWSSRPLGSLLEGFPELMARRLEEIEVAPASTRRWAELCQR